MPDQSDDSCFILSQEVDPKKMQLAVTPFLEKNAAKFMEELWDILLSAQDSVMGVPPQFIEASKAKLEEQRVGCGRELAKRQERSPNFVFGRT